MSFVRRSGPIERNLKKQCWNCRGCKPAEIKGDVIGFVQWHDRCDFLQACETLTGEPPPKDVKPNKGRIASEPKKTAWPNIRIRGRTEPSYLRFSASSIRVLRQLIHTNDGKRKKSFRQKRPDPDSPGSWL